MSRNPSDPTARVLPGTLPEIRQPAPAPYKVTAWNIEWLHNLIRDLNDPSKPEATRARLQRRLDAIHAVIGEIRPDILCVTEGPAGEAAIDQFTAGLAGYSAVKRPPGDAYTQQGRQWIWFIVRNELLPNMSLLPVQVWREYTELASPAGEHKARWPVYRWGMIESSFHSHYRHPQVLVWNVAGTRVELIGGHFKSKLTMVGNFNSADPAVRRTFIEETLANRMKLATEAQNVRYYLDQRFRQDVAPAIVVLGDLNDGPGKEFFERQFLFFDLLNNVQGDVFEAERFLNHALFDYPGDLRWTVQFRDPLDPTRDPNILLDHIMFTQAFVRNQGPLRVRPQAGKVEHEVFDRANALLGSSGRVSDHKPVSCLFEQVGPVA